MTPSQPQLDRHPGFQRLFRPRALTLGLILPLEIHPSRAVLTMQHHLQLAQRADELDFGALWMRDVPFFDPEYNDVAQVFEPMVYLGYLVAATVWWNTCRKPKRWDLATRRLMPKSVASHMLRF